MNMRRLYQALFPLAFLATLPGYLRRMLRRGNYRRQFGERFGWYSAATRRRLAEGSPKPWIQAVSVGEMLVALKLIAALRQIEPGLRMVLSTTTTTGLQLARERAGEGVEVIYTPIDAQSAVRRSYDAVRPSRVIVVDGGLWPNLLWEGRRRGIPTALVNARLSPRSEGRFRRFRQATGFIFGLIDLVCVPEPVDLERWASLGVPRERLCCTGSVKFDEEAPASAMTGRVAPADCLRALGVQGPVLLAASTHAGEERVLAEILAEARGAVPGLFLIIAPRHVERASQVFAELRASGWKVARRSQPQPGTADLLLLDTTGELRDWPAVATLVFIGKSLTAAGGQNPAEAVAAGRGVIFGPHMENFEPLASRLEAAGAAVRVADQRALASEIIRLMGDPAGCAAMGERGRALLETHRGAARRTAEALLKSARPS